MILYMVDVTLPDLKRRTFGHFVRYGIELDGELQTVEQTPDDQYCSFSCRET